VNLPGSPSGVKDGLAALEAFVEHAVAIVRGTATDHGAGAK
jgi:molybdopterin biosynthesis enzyme MoaB